MISRNWKSNPGVSPVDHRLAAQLHLRQIEPIIRSEGIGDDAERLINDASRDVTTITTSSRQSQIQGRTAQVAAIIRGIVPDLNTLFLDRFASYGHWSHDEVIIAWAKAVPRRWFRKASKDLAILPIKEEDTLPAGGFIPPIPPVVVGAAGAASELPGGDGVVVGGGGASPIQPDVIEIPGEIPLQADVLTEPIVRRERLSDSDWEGLLKQLVFQPPSADKVREILERADPNTGVNWQQRLTALSKLISNPEGVASEIVTGYAQGQSTDDIQRRIQPMVDGVRSSARRIARTEGLRVAESIQRESWDDVGDMMLGSQILAVLDENTRPHHAERNGQVYFKSIADGRPTLAELPHLPDEPNCRCWPTPVLRPPAEFENDPAVRSAFQNSAGAGIPDPATYDTWFDRADAGRRKMAVGVRRYNAMVKRFGGERGLEWIDFIHPDGKLLTLKQVRDESPADRALRKQWVRLAIDERKRQIQEVATTGFIDLRAWQLRASRLQMSASGPSQRTPPPEGSPELGDWLGKKVKWKQVEADLRKITDHEETLVVDKSGKVTRVIMGGEWEVQLTEADAAAMKGATTVHNHRETDDPPSAADILGGIFRGELETRVVSPSAVYTVKYPTMSDKQRAALADAVDQDVNITLEKVINELMDQITAGEDPDEALSGLLHRVWREVATRNGLTYRRVKR